MNPLFPDAIYIMDECAVASLERNKLLPSKPDREPSGGKKK